MSFLIPFEYHNGDSIDGMTVVNPVARGGNGDLYLVRDEAEKLLVLKIIRKTDNHDELNGIEQCRAVSSHVPELVPILKTGKLSDGRTYCVMPPADNVAQWPEYKPDTLADRIRQNGRMAPEDALEITGRILSAIKTLHDVGLAHCDIKPENIVFIAGEAKLTDYSLLSETAGYLYGKQDTAKDDSPDQSEIRPPVKTAGTVGFVPPEMLDNPVRYNSKMCDLYAVGKILYCAWTGSDVVSFPSVPRDISLQEIGIIRPLYMRACNVTPAKRFQSADEFISAVLDAKASVSHPFGTHFHGWFKNKRDVLLASLLVLVCVIGLVNILILLRSQSGKEKQNPDKIVTGLFYEEINDNGTNKGKQDALPPDPLIVTTDLDVVDANDGVNSLREALDYAQRHGTGATLSFSGGFEIRLSSPLSVTKDVILDAGTSRITLIGPETEPMFQVADSKLTLKNMSLVSDYTGDGGGILDATAFGKMDLFSVTDGGNAKLLWNVSHGFDVYLNDGTYLLKHFSTDGTLAKLNFFGSEGISPTQSQYVLDPHTLAKTTAATPAYYTKPFDGITDLATGISWETPTLLADQTVASGVDAGHKYMILTYLQENTLPKMTTSESTTMLPKYGTVLAIHYQVNDGTPEDRYDYYYLKHNAGATTPAVTDPMAFSIVRNNIYRVSLVPPVKGGSPTLTIKVKVWDKFTHSWIYM